MSSPALERQAQRTGATSPIESLAIFGGQPAFAEKLHVGRPNLGDRKALLQRVDAICDSRWLTNSGACVEEFEKRIADFVGVKHCIPMCSGTLALEIAIRALELAGEVIIPSFTFVATAHALHWQQITPVFCDIDPRTHNLNPAKIEQLITPRTTGILAVHLWGRPCAIDELEAIAHGHDLALLFDAAHAFGCRSKGRMIGGFGRAEVFSFHATKFITSGEGGAVVTNDDDLAARIRLMKNFGFSGYDIVTSIGTNGKMTELSAALGLTNLESIEEFIGINRRNFELYDAELAKMPGLTLLRYDESEKPNYQYVVIEVEAAKAGLTRDQLLAVLHAENVLARKYFYPGAHRMEPYCSSFPNAGATLPETEATAERVLVLPTGTGVTSADIRKVCAIIRSSVYHGREISAAFASKA
jgi:dTDP-4-amino-4,6-dideoxygalactose transaminase